MNQATNNQRTVTPQNNNFSWTYADVGVATHDYDGSGSNVTSLDGDISYALDQHIYVLGGMSYGFKSHYDSWGLNGGLGFHTPLTRNLDVFGEGRLLWSHNEYRHSSDNETGYDVRGGVRARITTAPLELKGGIYHSDLYDTDTGLFGSALYSLNAQTGVGARLSIGDNENTFGLFARYNF